MFVRFHLKSSDEQYVYDSCNLVFVCTHPFPSGKSRKCMSFILDNGTTINFPLSDVSGLCIENEKDERHPWNDDAKIIFVEDGQPFEKRCTNG